MIDVRSARHGKSDLAIVRSTTHHLSLNTLILTFILLRSRRHYSRLRLPSQRRPQIHPRLQHMHSLYRGIADSQLRVLVRRRIREQEARQVAGGGGKSAVTGGAQTSGRSQS